MSLKDILIARYWICWGKLVRVLKLQSILYWCGAVLLEYAAVGHHVT